jgi:hypothetical protein
MRRRKLLALGSVGIGLWILGRSKPVHAIIPVNRANEGPASTPAPEGYLPRTYDAIYRAECPGVPAEYLRALAYQESRTNPGETKGSCWGLLQVCPVVLKDYNEKFGTGWTMGNEMLQAEKNARVACELIRRIPGFYVAQHPQAFPGGFSWSDRRHVDLLTMGWNTGWSESTGVCGAIGTLLGMGKNAVKVTIDAISQASRAGLFPAKFTAKLGQANVPPWVKGVSALYFRELRAPGA